MREKKKEISLTMGLYLCLGGRKGRIERARPLRGVHLSEEEKRVSGLGLKRSHEDIFFS